MTRRCWRGNTAPFALAKSAASSSSRTTVLAIVVIGHLFRVPEPRSVEDQTGDRHRARHGPPDYQVAVAAWWAPMELVAQNREGPQAEYCDAQSPQ
ncbi:MAG: hypothetical protein JWO87_2271 [Phycisphaerales bacterium]|nr:hypothetical protein [Phycisphaerales bacterium]